MNKNVKFHTIFIPKLNEMGIYKPILTLRKYRELPMSQWDNLVEIYISIFKFFQVEKLEKTEYADFKIHLEHGIYLEPSVSINKIGNTYYYSIHTRIYHSDTWIEKTIRLYLNEVFDRNINPHSGKYNQYLTYDDAKSHKLDFVSDLYNLLTPYKDLENFLENMNHWGYKKSQNGYSIFNNFQFKFDIVKLSSEEEAKNLCDRLQQYTDYSVNQFEFEVLDNQILINEFQVKKEYLQYGGVNIK